MWLVLGWWVDDCQEMVKGVEEKLEWKRGGKVWQLDRHARANQCPASES